MVRGTAPRRDETLVFCHLGPPVALDDSPWRWLWFDIVRHERFVLTRGTAYLLLDCLADVLDQVKAIGDLPCLGAP
jgi:hypothetical protein